QSGRQHVASNSVVNIANMPFQEIRHDEHPEGVGRGKLCLDVASPLGSKPRHRLLEHYVAEGKAFREGPSDVDISRGHLAGREVMRCDTKGGTVPGLAEREENVSRISTTAQGKRKVFGRRLAAQDRLPE